MSATELRREIEAKLAQLGYTSPEEQYNFTKVEIRDILIASGTLIFAFTIALMGGYYIFIYWDLDLFLLALEFSAIGIATGFIAHELSHKFIAQRYGFKAHFQLWTLGIIVALITAFFGFIFAAPGAVYIEGEEATPPQLGKISVSGPIANLLVAGPFLLIFFLSTGFLQQLCFMVAFLNGFLAFFNLLPIPPLDGYAVYEWNKKILFLLLGLSIAIVVFGELYAIGII